jgi:hypothetical protein
MRDRSKTLLAFLAIASATAGPACRSDQQDNPPPPAADAAPNPPADAGRAEPDEGAAPAADAAETPDGPATPPAADAGAPAGAFSPAAAKVVYVGQGPSGGLEIIAANLRVGTDSGGSRQDWLVAVRNGGRDPICSLGVNAAFKDASGADLLAVPVQMNIDGETYLDKGAPFNCIGPGKVGVGAYPLSLLNRSVDPANIARIEHGFPGAIQPTAAPGGGITLKDVRVEPSQFGPKWSVLKGTVLATSAVRSVSIDVYPKNAAGMPLDHLLVSGNGLAVGATWDFTSTSYEGAFTDYYLLVRYRQ